MPKAVSISNSQKTVGTSATKLCDAVSSRKKLVVVNHGTTPVYVGKSGVTTSTGVLLAGVAGQTLYLDTAGELYGITASGTQVVGVLEDS